MKWFSDFKIEEKKRKRVYSHNTWARAWKSLYFRLPSGHSFYHCRPAAIVECDWCRSTFPRCWAFCDAIRGWSLCPGDLRSRWVSWRMRPRHSRSQKQSYHVFSHYLSFWDYLASQSCCWCQFRIVEYWPGGNSDFSGAVTHHRAEESGDHFVAPCHCRRCVVFPHNIR